MELKPPIEAPSIPDRSGADVQGVPDVSQGLPQLPLEALLGGQLLAADQQPDITAPAARGAESDVPNTSTTAEFVEAAEGEASESYEPQHPVTEGMDAFRAEEALGDDQARTELLRELDIPATKEVLNAVNGAARGLPQEEWGMDGRGQVAEESGLLGQKIVYDPPAQPDREGLLDEALTVAKELPPVHAATLTGLTINATHVYNNGCGRTSRWAYTAISHGYDGSPEDKQLYDAVLTETEGREVVDLDPSRMLLRRGFADRQQANIAEQHGYEGKPVTSTWGGYDAIVADEETPDTLLTQQQIPPAGRRALHRVVEDYVLGPNAFMKHMLDAGLDPGEYTFTSSDGQRTGINLDKLVPTLDEDGIKNITRTHRAMKREYVRDIIDTFSNPDRRDEAQNIVDFYRPPSWRR